MAKVYLDGLLIAHSAAEHALVDLYLDDHITLTRAEPGCLKFEVTEDPNDRNKWHVSEIFETEDAFEAHQTRVKSSEWGKISTPLERRFKKRVE